MPHHLEQKKMQLANSYPGSIAFINSLLPSWEQRQDSTHLKIIIIYYCIGNTVHWIVLEKKKLYSRIPKGQHSILLNIHNKTENERAFISFPVQLQLCHNG